MEITTVSVLDRVLSSVKAALGLVRKPKTGSSTQQPK
jgi:hypothetical protein